jgi:predicted dehydrogenase
MGDAATRVALIGLGDAAIRIHLPALQTIPSVRLVGACEPDAARRDTAGRRFGIPALYADAEELLRATAPDLVVIATPPATHYALAQLAIAHGAHVFCEKPFVTTMGEADAIIEAADRRQRLVAVNHEYRFMRVYRTAREHIERGEFGPPLLIQAWQQMFHPPSEESNWRAGLVESTMREFGTHALDLICYLFGGRPRSITAHMPRPRPEFAADLVVVCTMTFDEHRVASLVLNRISHAPMRYFEMRVDCRDASLRLSLGGVARLSLSWTAPPGRPTARASLVRGGEARVERAGRSRVLVRERRPAFASATAGHLRAFLARVERGDTDNAEARHARAIVGIIEAAYLSAREQRTIALDGDARVR